MKCGMSPFITGIFFNRIYIPVDLDGTRLEFVLRHELVHCKRCDILYKAAADMVSAIHFFNPAVYFVKYRINQYCELSCDERAVSDLCFEDKKAYSIAILNTVLQNRRHLNGTVALGEKKSNLKERVEYIMKERNYSKITRIGAAALALAAILTSAVFSGVVSAKNETQAPQTSYSAAEDRASIQIGLMSDDNVIYGENKSWFSTMRPHAIVVSYVNILGYNTFEMSWYAQNKETLTEVCGLLQEIDNKYKNDDESGADEIFEQIRQLENKEGSLTDYYQLKMTKKTRKFGYTQNSIEGEFTLTVNGKPVFENQKGVLQDLPPYPEIYDGQTTLNIPFEFEGNSYYLHSNIFLKEHDRTITVAYQKIDQQFKRSRDTRQVYLGKATQVQFEGSGATVETMNQYLDASDDDRYFNDVIWYNPKTQQAKFFLSLHEPEERPVICSLVATPHFEDLHVKEDSINGYIIVQRWSDEYQIYLRQDQTIEVDITGLNNPAGGLVTIQSKDGKIKLQYEIVEKRKEKTNLVGTREVSEFLVEGEDVFVGTPAEQEDFDRDEHDRYYKRIVVDDNGKVVYVIPIENQHGDILNDFTTRVRNHENGYTCTSDYESLPSRLREDGKMQAVGIIDPVTWWITAVLTPENNFAAKTERDDMVLAPMN